MHQYLRRKDKQVVDEVLFADTIVRFLYSSLREKAPSLFNLLIGQRVSSHLALLNFDLPFTAALLGNRRFLERCGVDLEECLEGAEYFTTPRKVFERKIRYWECRPMPDSVDAILSPADAKMLSGSLDPHSSLFIKDKFFSCPELLGVNKPCWNEKFIGGDYAVFRLTPDKYHYSHSPVSGVVLDYYELPGLLHSCNPSAVIEIASPYSLNRRAVTIIDTDVANGSGIGLVAMIEVCAMMIGQVVQCYSEEQYHNPSEMRPGLFLRKGQVKSMYRPGSSTDILLFQAGKIDFAADILQNQQRTDIKSRYSIAFSRALVETPPLN